MRRARQAKSRPGAPPLLGTEGSAKAFLVVRYTVRKVTKGWMVWDTKGRAVAVVDDAPAIGISAETARLFADMLNSQENVAAEGEPDPGKRSG